MKHNNHDYVDLGLPSGTLWATCNVGADAPEAYGDYFAWGETKHKDSYDWATYKWHKYNYTDGKTTLDPEDDAAAVIWGGKWRMPTDDKWTELLENCAWTWTTLNGVNGYEVKSNTNGNTIFLPAAGFRDYDSLYLAGNFGYYWSSSLSTDYPDYAWRVNFRSGNVGWYGGSRDYGLSVRPVC